MNKPSVANVSLPSDLVTLSVLEGHVALVTLNRPSARNAINAEIANAMHTVVSWTEANQDIWVVVLTGAGEDVFCAGADLKEVAAGNAASLFTSNGFAGFVDADRKKPWIAAVNGKALAGGCEIVLACDLVVAANNAAFGLPEVSRGVLAAAGGLYRLPRALPRNLAIEMAITGDSIDAERAAEFGWVSNVVPPEHLLEAALALAARITRNAPIAVRESLQIIRRVPDLDTDALRKLTKECRDRVAASADYREGPRAFVEKRPPQWTGS